MNYYQILGVKRDATQAEIKKRYKSLMKKYHPDLYEGDKKFAESKAMEINMAYDTLSVPELREEYDMELSVEEESHRPDFSNYNPVNNSNPTQENHYSYYDNDEIMKNIYERYNRYKDNYIFHKHYKQTKRPNPTSTQYYNGYSTVTEEYVNEKINQAERYVEKRIDNLKLKQKILVFIIVILCLLLFFMISFYELAKFMEDYSTPPQMPEQESPRKNNYNIKNSIQGEYANVVDNSVTNTVTNTTNPEDEFYYDAYGNKVYPNRTTPEDNSDKSGFNGWNIDTNVLNGLSDQVQERLEYYYDYVIEYLDKNGAFKDITEDEAKTILYHYLYTTPQEYKEWIKEATQNINNALNQPESE